MKILSASQLKEADLFTIQHEPISSVHLMERAGQKLFEAIVSGFSVFHSFNIFCGPGNNGGDGLVLASLFHLAGKKVTVIILKGNYTEEFLHNFQKIKELKIKFAEWENEDQIDATVFEKEACIIDAIFGIGISRPAEGLAAAMIQKINHSANFKIAIDIPSGLSPDGLFTSTSANTIVANHTLSITQPKLSFFFPENNMFTGKFECIDIGISKEFIETQSTGYSYVLEDDIIPLLKTRSAISHKGDFGHVLIIAGSKGKEGAALLASKAVLKSGCGMVSVAVPGSAISPLLAFLPEAMTIARDDITTLLQIDLSRYAAIGFGPGAGLEKDSADILFHLLKNYKGPLVIDADGLTLLSQQKEWYSFLGPHIILTPHPGEFDRLTLKHGSGLERFRSQEKFSKQYHVNILLKGHYTSITTPDGIAFFNSTGNSGMATAGSGDVLTGIITSLCAQGYAAAHAAVLGAYLHGYAGNEAARIFSMQGLIASDIIAGLPAFFKHFGR